MYIYSHLRIKLGKLYDSNMLKMIVVDIVKFNICFLKSLYMLLFSLILICYNNYSGDVLWRIK